MGKLIYFGRERIKVGRVAVTVPDGSVRLKRYRGTVLEVFGGRGTMNVSFSIDGKPMLTSVYFGLYSNLPRADLGAESITQTNDIAKWRRSLDIRFLQKGKAILADVQRFRGGLKVWAWSFA